MEEQTVNEADIFEASDFGSVANEPDEEQAQEGVDGSAVEVTNEQTASENDAVDMPEATETNENAQTGDAIDEFLAKKGIKADDPEAIRKIAQMYQNAEKGFYQKSQEKAQLERQLSQARIPQMSPDQEALSQVRAMRAEMDAERWKFQHNVTDETEQKMVEYMKQPIMQNGQPVYDATGNVVTKAALVLQGALSLDDVFTIVGGNNVKVDNLKEQMRAEVRKEMTARQTSKRPVANATDSTKFGKPAEDDPFLAGLGL